MKSHDKSKLYLQCCQAAQLAMRAETQGTIAHQLQVDERQRRKNREAIKALVRSAHYLVCHHIAHTTNYDDLVSLMMNCGSQPLTVF